MGVELLVVIRASERIVQLFDCASLQPQQNKGKTAEMTQIQTGRGSVDCPILLLFDFM